MARFLTTGSESALTANIESALEDLGIYTAGGKVGIGIQPLDTEIFQVNGKIKCSNATESDEAVALGQLTSTYLPLAGGTMTGAINMGSQDITNGGAITCTELTVNGTTTTIDTATLHIDDGLVKIARTNSADITDSGVYCVYNDGTEKYAGWFRDATDGKIKIFDELTEEPTTTVNTGGVGYAKADLVAGDVNAVTSTIGTATLSYLVGGISSECILNNGDLVLTKADGANSSKISWNSSALHVAGNRDFSLLMDSSQNLVVNGASDANILTINDSTTTCNNTFTLGADMNAGNRSLQSVSTITGTGVSGLNISNTGSSILLGCDAPTGSFLYNTGASGLTHVYTTGAGAETKIEATSATGTVGIYNNASKKLEVNATEVDITNATLNLNSNAITNVASLNGITSIEIGYLDTVSSNIQTQLDSMVEKAGDTMTGTLAFSNSGASANITMNSSAVNDALITITRGNPIVSKTYTIGSSGDSDFVMTHDASNFLQVDTASANEWNLILDAGNGVASSSSMSLRSGQSEKVNINATEVDINNATLNLNSNAITNVSSLNGVTVSEFLSPVHLYLQKTATQTASNVTVIPITWDATATKNRGFTWSGSGSSITLPEDGLYQINATISHELNNVGLRHYYFETGGSVKFGQVRNYDVYNFVVNLSAQYNFSSGDTFSVRHYQDSGSSYNIYFTDPCELTVTKIGAKV